MSELQTDLFHGNLLLLYGTRKLSAPHCIHYQEGQSSREVEVIYDQFLTLALFV